MAQRVLVVEDDPSIRRALTMALADEGYDVTETASTEEALEVFPTTVFDVALVDLMLPGADGLECCRRLRRDSDVPIVILTARDDTHDVVAGLEAGADDYVTKPFQIKELTARMRAVARRGRSGVDGDDAHVIGDLEVRPEQGVVRLKGGDVPLTKTEFRLLCVLAEAPGRLFSRESLLERVWDYDYFGDTRLVDVHVRRLRVKIEDDPGKPQRLVTVRGLGYKLAEP